MMSNNRQYFVEFISWANLPLEKPKFVKIGDGKSLCQIMGIGTIDIIVNSKRILFDNVLFVPSLDKSLFSTKVFCQYQGRSSLQENNETILTFPEFFMTVPHKEEIDFSSKPSYNTELKPSFSSANAVLSTTIQDNKLHAYMRKTKLTRALNDLINQVEDFKIQSNLTVKIRKMHPNAKTLCRVTEGSIGYDLYFTTPVTIPPHDRRSIPTGLAISIPSLDIYGHIKSWSSYALHKGIDVQAGVIDSDYREEIMVLLSNATDKLVNLPTGSKMAQLIFEQAKIPHIKLSDILDETTRSENGFRSTDFDTFMAKHTIYLDDKDQIIAQARPTSTLQVPTQNIVYQPNYSHTTPTNINKPLTQSDNITS